MRLELVTFIIGILIGFAAASFIGDAKLTRIKYAYSQERLAISRQHAADIEAQQTKTIQAVNHAKQQTDAAISAANRAGVSAASLRQQLAKMRTNAHADSATGSCQAATGSVDLLSDMLGRLEEYGRELAAISDQRGVAGAACAALLESP